MKYQLFALLFLLFLRAECQSGDIEGIVVCKEIVDSNLSAYVSDPKLSNHIRYHNSMKNYERSYKIQFNSIQNGIISNLKKSESFFDLNMIDSGLVYSKYSVLLLAKFTNIKEFDYLDCYKRLFKLSLQYDDPAGLYLLQESIRYGNYDIDDILSYVRKNNRFDTNMIYKFLVEMESNYEKLPRVMKIFDPILRNIYFQDQLFRIYCYNHKSIAYKTVTENDIVLQKIFECILSSQVKYELFKDEYFQKTFCLLLTHAVSTPQSTFFEDNFRLYSLAFANDFRDQHLKEFVDLYLKFQMNKQYFNTSCGEGMRNQVWGKLDLVSIEQLIETFNKLKIKDYRL